MALPPLEAGAVQLTVAWALPAVALALVGAPGTVAGLNTPATMYQGVEVGNVNPACCWPAALFRMSSKPSAPEADWARLMKVTPWLEPGVNVPGPVLVVSPP